MLVNGGFQFGDDFRRRFFLDLRGCRAEMSAAADFFQYKLDVDLIRASSRDVQGIADADVIFVLRDGCVIEHGNHDELMAQKGFYYGLHNAQFVN